MTRSDMGRLDATDDPRPLSVSLQPLNKQLSMKVHKKDVKQDERKFFARDEHQVFFHPPKKKNIKKLFCGNLF